MARTIMQPAGTPQASPNHRDERAVLDQMLADARLGVGGSLVLRGESGSGKTSLLTYAVQQAAEFRVTVAAGVQPEMELGFAALHGLLTPYLPGLDHLPGPQQDALGTALGLVSAATPDRFLVGLAVLSLLTEAAKDRPLLLAIDDAHWLDEATADVLAFVARRLASTPVAFVVAVREPTTRVRSLDGLPPLHLEAMPRRHESASPGSAPAQPASLDAMQAGLMAGSLARDDSVYDAVRTALAPRTGSQPHPRTADLVLDGFTSRLTTGYPTWCSPANCPAPTGCRNAHRSGPPVGSHRLARAGLEASAVPDGRTSLAGTHADDSTLNPSTSALALGCWAAGELLDSSSRRTAAFDRERSALDQDGSTDPAVSSMTLALDQPNPALAHYALMILDLGNGRYPEALTRALAVFHEDPPSLGTKILPDLIEAAVRSGDVDAAASAFERLSERTRSSRAHLASGLLARSKALLTDDADAFYREAIEHLRQADTDVDLARTHLLYGEWLRRRRRRRAAREQLRAAQESFDNVGFPAFARRASVELRATSEAVRKRRGEPGQGLTSQEAEIARLVGEGSSNRQVAAQLFISQNTVEYHLQKVFRKIGVSSRTQLARAMFGDASR
jgi:DNA-binding CsgD family transcriptional regulator